jgi:hypothetical protein
MILILGVLFSPHFPHIQGSVDMVFVLKQGQNKEAMPKNKFKTQFPY